MSPSGHRPDSVDRLVEAYAVKREWASEEVRLFTAIVDTIISDLRDRGLWPDGLEVEGMDRRFATASDVIATARSILSRARKVGEPE